MRLRVVQLVSQYERRRESETYEICSGKSLLTGGLTALHYAAKRRRRGAVVAARGSASNEMGLNRLTSPKSSVTGVMTHFATPIRERHGRWLTVL